MNATYVAIASASWARALYLLAAVVVLLRQRTALAALVVLLVASEVRQELRRAFGAPRGRHAAHRPALVALARHAR